MYLLKEMKEIFWKSLIWNYKIQENTNFVILVIKSSMKRQYMEDKQQKCHLNDKKNKLEMLSGERRKIDENLWR